MPSIWVTLAASPWKPTPRVSGAPLTDAMRAS